MKIIQIWTTKAHIQQATTAMEFKKKKSKQTKKWIGEQKISEMIFNTTNAFEKNEIRSR